MDSSRRTTRIPLPASLHPDPVAAKGAELPPVATKGPVANVITQHRRNASPTYSDEPGTPMAEESWEAVAEQTGWTIADCLNQKLSFKKNMDVKLKLTTMSQHIKRLRAAGWHLHMLHEKLELDIQALKNALENEEKGRKQDEEQFTSTIQQLQTEITEVKAFADQQQSQYQSAAQAREALQDEVNSANVALGKAVEKLSKLEEERERLSSRLDEVEQQSKSMTELHQQAQKYQSQLQDYNSRLQSDVQALNDTLAALQAEKAKWAEENAELRGRVTAMETQVEALQQSEAAAKEIAREATQLKKDLEATREEHDTAKAALETTTTELQQIKELSGNSVEALQEERKNRELLENRTAAQAKMNNTLQQELALSNEQKALAEALADQRATEVTKLRDEQQHLQASLAHALEKISEGEKIRRKLHNTILELKGNIRVFCRVRPTVTDAETTSLPSGEPVFQFTTEGEQGGRVLDLNVVHPERQSLQRYSFAFDKVFAPAAKQQEVFEEIEQLVQSALDGYKVCIFAYGQTGSGKTYTMLGRPGDHGMIPRAMDMLFSTVKAMQQQGWRFEMKASMLEIYNEEYKDLLGKGPPMGKKHQVTHTAMGPSVSYLEVVDVSKPQKVAALLERAMQQRAVGATQANEHSSRSHFVFMLQIDGVNEQREQEVHGALNLIDLAGSERLRSSHATGDRLKETQNINKSLSSLGDVIVALAAKEQHVPYRNSKLTYLLQPYLGGDSKTLMFVNVAPTLDSGAESLCSLRFAAKVNACEIGQAKRHANPMAAHSRVMSSPPEKLDSPRFRR